MEGITGFAVHDHRPVSLPTARAAVDETDDPWERLEQLRARKGIQSPIKRPAGGWTGPEPVLPVKEPKKKRRAAAPKPGTTAARATPDPLPVLEPSELRVKWARFKELAAAGATARQISDELGVPARVVRADAKAAGIELVKTGGPGPGPGRAPRWDVKEGARLAAQGLSAREIGERVGAPTLTVRKVLQAKGVTLVDGRTRKPTKWDVDEATRLAGQGLTAREISEQVGANKNTVRLTLTRLGVRITDGRARFAGGQNKAVSKRLADLDRDEVRRLYGEHVSATAVAQVLDCSPQAVIRILHEIGVRVRSSGEVQLGRQGFDNAHGLKDAMRAAGVTSAQVRTWARDNDVQVADRGLPPQRVWDAYVAAHPTPTTKEHR